MPYVRITQLTPRSGQEARVDEVLRKLSQFYPTQPGFIAGYHFQPHTAGTATRMGRVGVWESEAQAQAAAQTEHALALRADLLRLVVEETHEELSFNGTPDPA